MTAEVSRVTAEPSAVVGEVSPVAAEPSAVTREVSPLAAGAARPPRKLPTLPRVLTRPSGISARLAGNIACKGRPVSALRIGRDLQFTRWVADFLPYRPGLTRPQHGLKL